MKKNFKENKLDDFIFKNKQVRLTMLVTSNYYYMECKPLH